ncbi:DOC family protein [Pseudovirgaria hyperparasitica]|uniref:DOC family protein n=1 Tax=Pseudovirgaria hyperparasitica TaxID=470096 RepID=A0A6A6WGH3_9PEZI|nr:DOC family protein [Pseudovirgaria hyperparasitica]KAF2760727.1 DOC family protein [Pseudovirgaria hyperparasitica]
MATKAAPQTYRFLTTAQVNQLHRVALHPRSTKPTQPTMLASAVASPVNVHHYERDKTVFQLAAVLAEKLMLNHAFQDGNKRTALLAADMFLRVNGVRLGLGVDRDGEGVYGLSRAQVDVTTRRWGVDDLARYYGGIARPVGGEKEGEEKEE